MPSRNKTPLEVVVRCAWATSFEPDARAKSAAAILDVAERHRMKRMRVPTSQRDYLAAHALTRLTLGELGRVQPARLAFRETEHGRPEVTWPRRARSLRFSLSHADGLVLCAVARGCPIGADVESERNLGSDPLGVAAAICSEHEHASLRDLPAAIRAERVLKVWSMKEAVAKATGRGVYLSLAGIAVDAEVFGPMTEPTSRHLVLAGDGSLWRVNCLQFAPHHVAAIAVPAEASRDASYTYELAELATSLDSRAIA